MRSVSKGAPGTESEPDHQHDPRAERRAARQAANRRDILDAAERVFGQYGVHEGSVRQIAELSGFSTGAIYLFFDNKQHLLAETLARRGAELMRALQGVAAEDDAPLQRLHRIVDATVRFFLEHPDFRRLLRQSAGSEAIVGPALAAYANAGRQFTEAMTLVTGVVAEGQARGQVRAGDPSAIAHLYSVLINEYVLLGDPDQASTGNLTTEQFHGLIDGALRAP